MGNPDEGPKPRAEKNSLELILEILLFNVLLVPSIVWAFIRKLFHCHVKSLDGKVVLVTGAANGLGKELALGFAREGCLVACVDIDEEKVLETAQQIVRDGEKARAYHTNVAKVDEISVLREAVERDLGPVDILVNNAALVYCRDLEDTPDKVVRAMTDVNFLSSVWMARAFLPKMKQRGSGHIVTISSLSAHAPVPHATMYAACKWAVTGFMESLRLETKDQGFGNIHFTTVHPTFLDSLARQPSFVRMKLFFRRAEVVAARTIHAVKRNVPLVSVPKYLYYSTVSLKFLPLEMLEWGLRIGSGGVFPLAAEEMKRMEPIIKDTTS